jgi:exosortase
MRWYHRDCWFDFRVVVAETALPFRRMKPSQLRQLFASQTGGDSTKRTLLVAAVLALVFYAYFVSKTCVVGIRPTSLVGWLVSYWSRGGEYAHGYVVPIIAAVVAGWKWKSRLRTVPLSASTAGWSVVLAAVVLYWVGVRASNPRIIAGSLVVLIFGLILYLAGWEWAKELWFPCAFLVFMIPVNFLEQYVSFPLRMFVARASTSMLDVVGLDVYQNGTGIYSRSGRFQPLDVADPCSGIRSLVALMALTSLYGYVTMDRSWKKWLLFLSSIPLAVLGNLARITTVALVAQGFGQDWAMKIYHDYSGYIVFSLAILCMIALGASLNLRYRELIYRWTQEEVPMPVRPRPARSGASRATK